MAVMTFHALALAALLLAGLTVPATAQESAPPPSPTADAPPPPVPADALPPQPVPRTVPVVLHTNMGDITIALEVERAPITAANFLRYVDEKRFDGTIFYRAFTYGEGIPGGFIQGGTQNDPARIRPPIAHEPTSQTGLSHTDGAVSLANGGPGTANGDFFIISGDMSGLDATETDPGFAVFGHVVAGMDVVRAIMHAPRSPTRGEGIMRGQMLEPPVRILTARRAPTPAD